MSCRSRLSSTLQGLFTRFGKVRRRRVSKNRQKALRSFESLELRLALAGINGPHAADPAYNPTQPYHIHAGLTIYVNSQKVTVPIFNPNPDNIHTHDTTGAIHIHPFTTQTTFTTLKDVFDSWRNATDAGKNPNAVLSSTNLLNNLVDAEHSLRMFVNGTETDAFEKYQIHDKDQIVLVYGTNPVVSLQTNQGPIVVELFEDVTPNTVSNFLTYVNTGAFDSTIFHRYVPGFVIQGGGFETGSPTFTSASQLTNVTTNAAIANEFNNWAVTSGTGASVVQGSAVIQLSSTADLSKVVPGNRIRLTGRTDGLSGSDMFDILSANDAANTVTVSQSPTGATSSNVSWAIFPRVNITNTIAMAKQGGDPNSATSQFFINLANNDSNLDLQNGGFTVFGRVLDVAQPATTDSSTPANQLLNPPPTSFVTSLTRTNAGGAFTDLPLAANNQLITLQSVLGEGEVKGIVFNDLDGNGTRGTGEVGRSGVTVYDDANNNSQFDTGEESTTTNSTGNYTLRLAPGQHRVRMVAVNSTTQSSPQAGYTVTVQVGKDIVARDFALTTLAAPTSIDLVAATDSGSNTTDNVTSFNNSTSQKAPQFLVGGVLAGATVQILSDGVVVGQATVPAGGNGTITVTANGTTTISDGTHVFTASQTLNGNAGAMAAASGLSVRIDTVGPQFTSTAPLTANTGVNLNYNAETNEETSGVTYTIQTPPTGATINATTGVVSWTPTAAQLGAASFTIVATDAAGNTSNQAVSLNVTKPPQVRVRLAVTDLNGNPLTAINVGNTFQLRAFVSDVRSSPTGARAIYEDITWNGNVASVVPGTLVYGNNYNQNTAGTITAGLLDEIGASSGSSTNLGSGEFQLFQVNLRADAAGSLAFVGNPPDVTPAHDITLFGGTAAVPSDEVDFGQTTPIQVRQVVPSSLAGFVYVDANNNGTKDTGEQAMPNVTITITGTDSFGAAVSRTATTGSDGSYKFDNLNPGSYKLKETQPTGQLNNLPILDGEETVGSQGGTKSANDELTITLAEGINGTNNNFAELTGHTLGGTVEIDESPGNGTSVNDSALSFTGVQISLYSADSQNKPVGNPLRTAQINPDGSYSFPGLATGTYVTNVATPVFLTGATQNQVVQVGSTTTQTPVLIPAVRQARFISYLDFLNSSPRHGVFAAVTPGASDSVWTAFDSSWNGFRDLSVTTTSNGTQLRIDATTSTGQVLFDQIPINDPRVHTIGQEGTTKLFRLAGGADDYNLRTTSSTASTLADESNSGGSGEGEGEGSAWTAMNAESEWVPTSTIVSMPPLNETNASAATVTASESLHSHADDILDNTPSSPSDSADSSFAMIVTPEALSDDLLQEAALAEGEDHALIPAAVDQAVAEDFDVDELDEVADDLAISHSDEHMPDDLLAYLLEESETVSS